jgi:metallo-beta-lactamase family protein
MLEIDLGGRKLVFSGDLGRPGTPFLRDPEKIAEADWLVLESTYGNRDHGDRKVLGKRLMQIVLETIDKGGNVVIPSFAIGRAQDILFMLNPYAEKGELKGIKSFVDSPMSISAIEVYRRHPECFDAETMAMLKRNDSPLEFPGIQYVRSREDSKAINAVKEPHIIISANGMCTGGRILHHLLHNLEREACTILLVGYQADGTLGRRLLSGAKKVRVMGREVEVRARIESLDGFSAHADKSEIMKWLDGFDEFPKQVFLNHGEPEASRSLAEAIRDKFAVQPVTAKGGESYNLA